MRGLKMADFKCEAIAFGTPEGTYPGMFSPPLIKLLKSLIGQDKTLHLFSGSSTIGHTRIDLEHEAATHNIDVIDFLKKDDNIWDWVILDPPYEGSESLYKDMNYAKPCPIGQDQKLRSFITKWFNDHAINILWFDWCAPIWSGVKREKVWLVLPGGYRKVRALSHLKNIYLRSNGVRGLANYV